jgi:UDP-2,3-diacylglucosamine pyrophosphatase LpxH
MIDTVVISDWHLGSALSDANGILACLKSLSFKRLILLGDIFQDLNFSRLKKEHWEVLSYLRKLSNPKLNIEIVWVKGNHDLELTDVMSHLVGIEVHEKYEWTHLGKRCVAMHGHQFDPAMLGNLELTKVISWWFLQLQKIPGFNKSWCRWIDSISGYFQNLSQTVSIRALKFAKSHGYDIICCGHTHEECHIIEDNVHYFNSGCWINNNGTYISFNDTEIIVVKESDVKD